MNAPCLLFCAFFLTFSSRWAAADPLPTRSVAMPVPAHVFLKPQPEWVTLISYQKFLDDDQGFMGMTPAERDASPQICYKEIRYFKNAGDAADPNRDCKLLLFNPQGSLVSESDRIGSDQYDRDLYGDGSLRLYMHWHLSDFLHGTEQDGISISPTHKTVSRFSGGTGELIVWGSDENTLSRQWFSRGNEYLKKEYVGTQCRLMRLNGPADDFLIWTPQREDLFLSSVNEVWRKPQDGRPFQIKNLSGIGNFDTHGRPRDKDAEMALAAQRAEAYARRRAHFMAVYSALLTRAGQSWQSLGLSDIYE